MRRSTAVVAGTVVALGALVAVRALQAQDEPANRPASDLTVVIRHLNGDTDTYAGELTDLDLVVDPTGRLQYIHCVLVSGTERDTHVWYNFENVSSVKYRFHAITGKAKVSVKQLASPTVKEKPGLPAKIDRLDVEDYK